MCLLRQCRCAGWAVRVRSVPGSIGGLILGMVGLGLVAGVVLVGCGGPGLETVPVTGRVTYGGGTWPKEGRLDFRPVAALSGKTLHPASAQFGTDGRYKVMTQQTAGLAPGEYVVTVECWQEPPTMGDAQNPHGSPGKSYVPEKYRDPKQSPIRLKIEPGDRSKTFDFDVPKP
jgi:hypothetical protein